MAQRKVLFVATTAKTHINTFHLPSIRFFTQNHWRVDVASNADAHVPGTQKEFAIPIHRNPVHPHNLCALLRLIRIMRTERYDLISCHTPMGGVLARLAAWMTHTKPLLYTAHGFHFYQGAPLVNQAVYKTVEKLLAPLTDGLITMNREDYEAARRFRLRKAGKCYRIPGMGVDLAKIEAAARSAQANRRALGIASETFVVLTVAELNANKNYKTTLRAFAAMRRTDCVYVICGRGEKESELRRMAQTLGIGERVLFLGYREEIAPILHMADVFLLASFREGLSIAPLEAMAAGKPLIISDNRSSKEFAQNGCNALVCEAADVQGFTRALDRLSQDEKLCRCMGARAKQSVVRFSAEKAYGAIASIYEEWMN